MALFSYGHENYIDDLQRKEQFIQKMQERLEKCRISCLKKRKVNRLMKKLHDFQFLLDEPEQTDLVMNEEIWSSDCLEYNVNRIYDYIMQHAVKKQKLNNRDIISYCRFQNDCEPDEMRINHSLRRSRDKNPVIILVNDMFRQPFVINGNQTGLLN